MLGAETFKTVPDFMSRETFCKAVSVSRETADRLEAYITLLKKWNKTINLVSSRSLDDPWRRHILDSAQLTHHMPNEKARIVDLGSGAGLPGIIIALIMQGADVHLVESDQRKTAFLREASRVLGCKISIHMERIETAINKIQDIDVFTARALAPLPKLLKYIEPALNAKKICIFHKTEGINKELDRLNSEMFKSVRVLDSVSDPRGKILVLEVEYSE